MDEIFAQIFQIGFFAAMIRIATPLIFGTLGELFAERAGILNLGIEGIMMLAAMTGFSAAYFSGSLWLGVLAAIATGVVAGLAMGVLTVSLGLSQHVSGLGITMLCSGLSFFFYRLIFGQPSSLPSIKAFEVVRIPVLASIPFIGPILFDQFALVYLCMLLVPTSAWILYRTPWGLSLRTVGENPHAAYAGGISVTAVRYQALMLSGALMGVAGAFLSMAQYNAYTFGVISGRGWVCIALIVFGQWSPWKSAAGALL
ncbi:MAG: ABC transporter permease, partial [Delftia sp.]|nr:ABC transporter permease [Delftia sp.]